MFTRRLRVSFQGQPCPLAWLDNFAMRNFTNDAIFDDTLPVSDGVLEVGARVPLPALKRAMEDWFQRKGYIPKASALDITELS